MAYVQQQLDDEEEKKAQGEGGPLQLTEGGGAENAGTVVEGGGEGATASPAALRPSAFTDVQAYLGANQPGALELADRVAGKIGERGTGIQTDVGARQTQFESSVAGARTPLNESLIRQGAADPTKLTPEQKAELIRQRDANYAGPKSFDTADFETRVADIERLRGGLGTEQGQREVLQQTLRRPSEGNVRLSQLLLGGSADAQQRVKTQTEPWGALRGFLGTTKGAAEAKATAAQAEADQARATFGTEFGKARESFGTGLTTRLNETLAQQQARAKAAKAALGGGTADAQSLADLGLSAADLSSLQGQGSLLKSEYGVEPGLEQFISQNVPQLDITDVATQDDLARQKALEELTGQSIGKIRAEDAARFGKAPLDITEFNQGQAKAGVTGALQGKDQDLINRYFQGAITDPERKVLERAKTRQPDYWAMMSQRNAPPPEVKAPSILDTVIGKGKPVAESPLLYTNPYTAAIPMLSRTFCFLGDTLVNMADGSKKKIADVNLGDDVKEGGTIYSIRRSLSPDGDMYDYLGTFVTGYHAVLEKGHWIRVKNSVVAKPVKGQHIVYSLVNEYHRIVVDDVTFADEHETDNYEHQTIDESLAELNKTRWLEVK